jgi:hypothetical protein
MNFPKRGITAPRQRRHIRKMAFTQMASWLGQEALWELRETFF